MGRTKKNKEDRATQRAWADGVRETILTPHIEPYADALTRGWVAERAYLQVVLKEYNFHIPWRLQNHEEPKLPLKDYLNATELERELVVEVDLAELELQSKALVARKEQIQRWYHYRATRLKNMTAMSRNHEHNPFRKLLATLTGVDHSPVKKALQGWQQLCATSYDVDVKPTAEKLWQELKDAKKGTVLADLSQHLLKKTITEEVFASKISEANSKIDSEPMPFKVRQAAATTVFNNLPKESQRTIKEAAIATKVARAKQQEIEMARPYSKEPGERLLAIRRLGPFLSPILSGILEVTGLVSTVIIGGPSPENGGEISTWTFSNAKVKGVGGTTWTEASTTKFADTQSNYEVFLECNIYSAQDILDAVLPTPFDAEDSSLIRFDNDRNSPSDSETDSDNDEPPRAKTNRRQAPNKNKALPTVKAKPKPKALASSTISTASSTISTASSTISTASSTISTASSTISTASSTISTPSSSSSLASKMTATASPSGMVSGPQESEYEKVRNANIARNASMMRNLMSEAPSELRSPIGFGHAPSAVLKLACSKTSVTSTAITTFSPPADKVAGTEGQIGGEDLMGLNAKPNAEGHYGDIDGLPGAEESTAVVQQSNTSSGTTPVHTQASALGLDIGGLPGAEQSIAAVVQQCNTSSGTTPLHSQVPVRGSAIIPASIPTDLEENQTVRLVPSPVHNGESMRPLSSSPGLTIPTPGDRGANSQGLPVNIASVQNVGDKSSPPGPSSKTLAADFNSLFGSPIIAPPTEKAPIVLFRKRKAPDAPKDSLVLTTKRMKKNSAQIQRLIDGEGTT